MRRHTVDNNNGVDRLMYPIEALKNDPNDPIALYVLVHHTGRPYVLSPCVEQALATGDGRQRLTCVNLPDPHPHVIVYVANEVPQPGPTPACYVSIVKGKDAGANEAKIA